MAKGRKVAVNGKIQTGSYINQEGQKVYTTEVVANNIEFLSPKQEQKEAPQESVPVGFEAIQEEIPF